MADAITGELSIAEDVITDLAGYAALESYGVVGMAAPTLSDGIAKLLPASRLRRGINVEMVDDQINVDLYIIIEHGTNLAEVSRMLADKVKFALSDGAQLPVRDVNIHVQGVKIHDK